MVGSKNSGVDKRTDGDEDGSEGRTRRPPSAVGQEVLSKVFKVARLVFLVLAALVVLGIIFTLIPTNNKNGIVKNVLDIASHVAGPFKDIFKLKDPKRSLEANYAVAAGVYVLASVVCQRLARRG